MARPQRDLKREHLWRRHLERQRARGSTVRSYCREHGLAETAFYFWRQEIAKRDRAAAARSTAASPAPAFVPVAVIDSPTNPTDTAIDIRLAAGHRVRVRPGCDRGLLADVLAILERRPLREGRPC